MATNPDTIQQHEQDRRKREAEAAALLALLLGRLKVTRGLPKGGLYSLPAMIANAKANPTPFRRIIPTESLRSDIATPYFDVVRAWAAERGTILAAYADALPARGEALAPNAVADVQRAIDAAERRVLAKLPTIQRKVHPSLDRLATWHRGQWVNRIRAATGLDVAPLTGQGEVAAAVSNAVTAGIAAVKGASDEIARKTAAALTDALTANVPTADAATMLSGTLNAARKRAARKGVDAADGLSGGMLRARRIAAGLEKWTWRHSPNVRYPRPIHVARESKVFSSGNQPSEMPGQLIGCQCWEEPSLS